MPENHYRPDHKDRHAKKNEAGQRKTCQEDMNSRIYRLGSRETLLPDTSTAKIGPTRDIADQEIHLRGKGGKGH